MASKIDTRHLTMTVPWNIFLLTVGGIISGAALKCIAVPHGFISGSLFGTGILIYYTTQWLTPAIWYTLINIPIFIIGWRFVGRRFFFYTLYGMLINTLAVQFIPWVIPIQNTMLAAVSAGCIYGLGLAVMLRSLGCDGGLTIVAIILNQRYDFKIGTVSLVYNLLLFGVATYDMEIDLVLYSMILVFVQASIIDHSMRVVSQRKLVYIISSKNEEIAQDVLHKLARGCTFLPSRGAYTNTERPLLMTVVHNFQLKRLEELAYQKDERAFLIVENTYDVIGQGFSKLKRY